MLVSLNNRYAVLHPLEADQDHVSYLHQSRTYVTLVCDYDIYVDINDNLVYVTEAKAWH